MIFGMLRDSSLRNQQSKKQGPAFPSDFPFLHLPCQTGISQSNLHTFRRHHAVHRQHLYARFHSPSERLSNAGWVSSFGIIRRTPFIWIHKQQIRFQTLPAAGGQLLQMGGCPVPWAHPETLQSHSPPGSRPSPRRRLFFRRPLCTGRSVNRRAALPGGSPHFPKTAGCRTAIRPPPHWAPENPY